MSRNKKKVSIYVRNSEITPSSYYRVVQYVKEFNINAKVNDIAPTKMYLKNIKLNKEKKINYILKSLIYYFTMVIRVTVFICKDLINKPDYIIVSKYVLPKYMPFITRMLFDKLTKRSKLYWDFDDLIFKENGKFTKQDYILGNNSEKIIVTSDFLKSKLLNEWQNKVELLPTTDGDLQGFELEILLLDRKRNFENEIRLVWVATSINLPHIESIIYELDDAAKIINSKIKKKVILTIVCDKELKVNVKNIQINNIKWTREKAREEIYKAHIGLMPLIHSEFSLGKGGFKLVQYISTGLPVIASDVGFNKAVVNEKCGILIRDKESWTKAILKISENEKEWEAYSKYAYDRWQEKFSYKKNLDFWNSLFK